MDGSALGKGVDVLVGFEVVQRDSALADHFVEFTLEGLFVLLAEPWIVVDEVCGDPGNTSGLVVGAHVDDAYEGLPEVRFRDFVVVGLEAGFGASFDDGGGGVDNGEAVGFDPYWEVCGVGGVNDGPKFGAICALGGSSEMGADIAPAVDGKEHGPS